MRERKWSGRKKGERIAKSKRSQRGCSKDGWGRGGAGGDRRFDGIVLREEPLVLEVKGGVGAPTPLF